MRVNIASMSRDGEITTKSHRCVQILRCLLLGDGLRIYCPCRFCNKYILSFEKYYYFFVLLVSFFVYSAFCPRFHTSSIYLEIEWWVTDLAGAEVTNAPLRSAVTAMRLASQEKCWRLSVRRSTINPAYKLCYRYRTHSGFTHLKPNPTFNSDRILGAKTKYLLYKSELLASKCSSLHHRSGLETLLLLSDALRIYCLKTKPKHSILTGN